MKNALIFIIIAIPIFIFLYAFYSFANPSKEGIKNVISYSIQDKDRPKLEIKEKI